MTKLPIIEIVDDEPTNLSILTLILKDKYHIRAANSGEHALKVAISKPQPDLILLDIMMPEMDGYTVLTQLKQNPETRDIPVMFVTAMDDITNEEIGFKIGAVDYITKPINPAILLARVKAQLTLKQVQDFLLDKNEFLETEINRRMAENLLIQNASIRALAHLAETRAPETGGHILRTQAYVKLLTKKLKSTSKFKNIINKNYIDLITRSAPLHDIGKVGIPDKILLKPSSLDKDEWKIMKTHATLGAKAIEQAEKDVNQSIGFFKLAKEIALWHHEKWDGSGYPDGLSGDDIPLSARIMAIADVFDALISQRVYKKAFSLDYAKKIIESDQSSHFDPTIKECFLANYKSFFAIANKYRDHD